jgi:NAD(P)-dependent dehydrogenase (short-subunit alcohol dehydrogenase family)
MNLSGKVFIVTGAFGALGPAVTDCLVSHGARPALVGRRSILGAEHPPAALCYPGVDVLRQGAVAKMAAQLFKETGRIDGLINLAGGFQWGKIEGGTVDDWDAMFRVNLLTAVASCQAVLPYLLRSRSGSIVNVGAMGAIKATGGMGAYAASKAGILKLTEALADEVKDQGIRVNAVLPSILDTPRNRTEMPDADFTRWVSPKAVAEVIAFLVSDAADAISGAALPVAGRV